MCKHLQFGKKCTHLEGFYNGKGPPVNRWQHVSWLKASAFCIWYNKLWWFKTQQLILGTGTAIWWATEPHCYLLLELTVYDFHAKLQP